MGAWVGKWRAWKRYERMVEKAACGSGKRKLGLWDEKARV